MASKSADSASRKSGRSDGSGVARGVGRPRRLSLSQILDAAIGIGLNDLTMTTLAESLNVRVAVLYNYVSGRAELVRLAAQRASGMAAFPEDSGQSWRAYAAQYAEAHYKLVEEGQFVFVLLRGDLSPSAKVDSVEQWLQVMLGHGFTHSAALELLRAIDVIVLGGALLTEHAKAIAGDERAYCNLIRTAVARRPAHELPILSQHAGLFADSAASSWRNALRLLLDGIADPA